MKLLLILGVALAAPLLSSCLVSDRHGNIIAVMPVGHVHSDDCGHYSHGDTWYHHEGHRHGMGCGHVHVGGAWVYRN